MDELTPADAERDLARGRLAPDQLPDVAAAWLSGSTWDSPALRELAGHPRNDLDGIRTLWAQARTELGVRPRCAPTDGPLDRSQFLEVIEDLAAAVVGTDELDGPTRDLLGQLWWALNGPAGRRIEDLRPEEEALIVRAYAESCDVTEPWLDAAQQREASAAAVLALRHLVQVVTARG